MLVIQEAPELAAPARVFQLAQRFRLDLADTFAGHIELLADFLERVVGVHADAEAHAQDAFLAGGEAAENAGRGFAQVGLDGGVERDDGGLVLDEVAEVAVLFVADRRLEADRLLGDFQNLADLFERHAELFGEFLGRRLAADFVQHLAAGAHQLVDRLDHVHRNADGARLIGNAAGDRLADPPGGIGREFVAAAVFELIDRLHQADVAFLDEIEELQAAVGVFFCDRNDQAKVGLDHLLLGARRIALAAADGRVDAAELGDRQAGVVRNGRDLCANVGDLHEIFAGERFPAFARQAGDGFEPVRIELVAAVAAEEIVTADLAAFGKTQELAFENIEALGELLELHDQFLDAVVVQPHLLDAGDEFLAQLLVALLRPRVHLFAGRHGVETLRLHLAQLLVGAFDLLKRREHFRLEFFLQRRQRQARALAFLAVVHFLGRRRLGNLTVTGCLDAGDLCLGRRAGALRRLEVDDVAQQHAAGFQRVVPGDDGAEGERALAQAVDHHVAAGFDAFGDSDLAFARQQFHRAHFAQVHADGIVGAAEALLVHIAGGLTLLAFLLLLLGLGCGLAFLVLLVLDDLDAHFVEVGHHVLDLFGGLVGREDGVQLIEGDVATFLALRDEPLCGGRGDIEQRGISVLLGRRRLCSRRLFRCHSSANSNCVAWLGRARERLKIQRLGVVQALLTAAEPVQRQHQRVEAGERRLVGPRLPCLLCCRHLRLEPAAVHEPIDMPPSRLSHGRLGPGLGKAGRGRQHHRHLFA